MDKLYREERVPFVKDFLERHPICQIRWDDSCQGKSVDVHEVLSRARGGNLVPIDGNEDNFLASCRLCHTAITTNTKEAESRGFSI